MSAEANLLFVESPIGVGFSYTNTSSDLKKLDDAFVGNLSNKLQISFISDTLLNYYLFIFNAI